MFKKLKVLVVIAATIMLTATLSNAQYTSSITSVSKVSCEGNPDSSGNCPIETDESRYVTFAGGSVLEKIELSTTSDTLTTAECGKTVYVNISSGNATYTLPDADGTGCNFKFVAVNGHATSTQGRIIVDPQSADILVACVNGTATSTFAVGDSIRSAEATGDTLKVTSYADGSWGCSDRIGVWVDNN
jgi:hypothetical protein